MSSFPCASNFFSRIPASGIPFHGGSRTLTPWLIFCLSEMALLPHVFSLFPSMLKKKREKDRFLPVCVCLCATNYQKKENGWGARGNCYFWDRDNSKGIRIYCCGAFLCLLVLHEKK
eukprot:RCo032234